MPHSTEPTPRPRPRTVGTAITPTTAKPASWRTSKPTSETRSLIPRSASRRTPSPTAAVMKTSFDRSFCFRTRTSAFPTKTAWPKVPCGPTSIPRRAACATPRRKPSASPPTPIPAFPLLNIGGGGLEPRSPAALTARAMSARTAVWPTTTRTTASAASGRLCIWHLRIWYPIQPTQTALISFCGTSRPQSRLPLPTAPHRRDRS